MTEFRIHTLESAPESARPLLEQLKQQLGFVPNLAATMAESPLMLIIGQGCGNPGYDQDPGELLAAPYED